MDETQLARWLGAYGRAWEERDPRAAGELFTEDAIYHEDPFDEPMKGREAIVRYWSGVPETQTDIRFGFELVAVTGNIGVARWWSTFTRIETGVERKLDGVFILEFRDGRCSWLREWWHGRP